MNTETDGLDGVLSRANFASKDATKIEEALSRAKFASEEDSWLVTIAMARLFDYERGWRMLAVDIMEPPYKLAIKLFKDGELEQVFYLDPERKRPDILEWLTGKKDGDALAEAFRAMVTADDMPPFSEAQLHEIVAETDGASGE